MKFVVLFDPRADGLREGTIVEGVKVEAMKAAGVALLPVEGDLLGRNGASGWTKRCWGEGDALHPQQNRRGCPIVLHVSPYFPTLHWIARVVPVEKEPRGMLRMSVDTTQIGVMPGGLNVIEGPTRIEELGEAPESGGWLVRGKAGIHSNVEGFLGLGLFGTLAGCRVEWLAVSQTR